jgi:hypothetical protein
MLTVMLCMKFLNKNKENFNMQAFKRLKINVEGGDFSIFFKELKNLELK